MTCRVPIVPSALLPFIQTPSEVSSQDIAYDDDDSFFDDDEDDNLFGDNISYGDGQDEDSVFDFQAPKDPSVSLYPYPLCTYYNQLSQACLEESLLELFGSDGDVNRDDIEKLTDKGIVDAVNNKTAR